MITLTAKRTRYEELIKNPLLFLRKIDRSYFDRDGIGIEDFYWEPIDNDFYGRISHKDLVSINPKFELVVADQIIEGDSNNDGSDKDIIKFKIHPVDSNSFDDWRAVIDSFIIRSQNSLDNYPFIHILWMLNYRQWNAETIVTALSNYDIQSQPYIINKALCKICRCLSKNKQIQMKYALARYNVTYQVYSPSLLTDAFSMLYPNIPWSNNNLFELVDKVLNDGGKRNGQIRNTNNQNPFIRLYSWLHSSEESIDYSYLIPLYSSSSHSIQMNIVKRYFHDIRLGKTTLEVSLLKQFKDCKYSDFIRYRYCLFSPEESINLSVPLFCDCILTLLQTDGKAFQSFDGILDFVVTHCDVTKPNISLGMNEFLPTCNGGAVYNTDFKGFIDYSIVCELDESKFSTVNLQSSIRELLDRNSHHLRHYVCKFENGNRHLSEEQLHECLSNCTIRIKEGLNEQDTCYTSYIYSDKWLVHNTDYDWLNLFLRDPLPVIDKRSNVEYVIIDIGQTSTEIFEKNIRSLAFSCDKVGENRFLIKSSDIKALRLLLQYSKPITMRIIPQSLPVIGKEFDIFGIWESIKKEHNVDPYSVVKSKLEELKKEFRKRESEELRNRVVKSLKAELKFEKFLGDYFELPYDRDLLRKLIGLYYFKGSIPPNHQDKQVTFLKRININRTNFIPFCAPKLSDVHNLATDLPFFWCRGLECFHNNLKGQTLTSCTSWEDYTLYHIIEIIGYPKLIDTEAGYEPDVTIKEFIACANRAIKKFRRLKCRNCGHLMYTDRSSGFNRYNYYSCINPTCSEYHHAVYLSYCFKCKNGLIDSRDSAQCPNGWYICPDCHSCCDDAQYERQAQRYILQKLPIPSRVESKLGHGHNDKGIYYCHICGSELHIYGEKGKEKWKCLKCNKELAIFK